MKVDRDERPDVDARYQSAISAISGQGGWPLTAFLTPDGKPFYGGTYFPPDDAMGRPGLKRILLGDCRGVQVAPQEVDISARSLEEAVAKAEFSAPRAAHSTRASWTRSWNPPLHLFDEKHGGFGQRRSSARKRRRFVARALPGHARCEFASCRRAHARGNGAGGVYDQIGGGFHRYSVDERWCVPHFEKMSYDNSELLKNFLHGYQVTETRCFAKPPKESSPGSAKFSPIRERGGFYASQDADQTLDDDGDYFTWTVAELREVLSPEESRAIEIYYDVGRAAKCTTIRRKMSSGLRPPEEIARI